MAVRGGDKNVNSIQIRPCFIPYIPALGVIPDCVTVSSCHSDRRRHLSGSQPGGAGGRLFPRRTVLLVIGVRV